MNNNNHRFHQQQLPGLDPITTAALDAAKLAFEQERLRTEQERQRLLRDQMLYAANNDTRQQASHAARQARENDAFAARAHYEALRAQAEARRSTLDEQYKQEQLNFLKSRARMQHRSDLVNQLCALMKTFGQLWYQEEQLHVQRVDVAMRHWQGMQRLRLQALNDAVMQQIAFLKAFEANRHNLAMEGETGRHNRQMEVNSWWMSILKFREECRTNHVQEFTRAWQAYYQLRETQRANDAKAHNDAQRNVVQAWHFRRMQDLQAQFNQGRLDQSRGGCKGAISTILWTLGTLFALFILLCVFVFTHWTGGQSYDGTCLNGLIVVFLIIVIAVVLKIRNGIVQRKREKEDQQQYQAWLKTLGAVPPPLQQHQGEVPPWMFPQYQQYQGEVPVYVMPPMPVVENQQHQVNGPEAWNGQLPPQFGGGTLGNQRYLPTSWNGQPPVPPSY